MNDFKKFIKLSRALGRRVDFVQGAGGNVSIKIDDKIMLIKASGWRLADFSEGAGLSVVDYKKIINEENFDFSNYKNLRPSIETGFHAFLGKYVIHTHSVYANIIACVAKGEKIWGNIFNNSGILTAWIDYKNPGVSLARAVKNTIKKFKKPPEAILLANHGLIVSSDYLEKVFEIHAKIQEIIQKRLSLKKKFPATKSQRLNYLKKFFKNNGDLLDNFSKNILFPDQAVFCGSIGEKILINKTGVIIYKTNQKEALTIEENLIALAYIVDCAKDCGLVLNYISQENLDYLNNMESEKYRKKLLSH